jgi:D-glycero-alpha-D-manno-heptose-7-phosphate kinase
MMIVSRTPLRVSFFGGGTDYPDYFMRSPGAVLGMAIDKYVYVSALRLSSILEYRYRLSYSKIEMVSRGEDIQHPVVRSLIAHYKLDDPLDINIIADLPARSGLGSSSSFTVGFINLIHWFQQRRTTKLDLARAAVHVERDLLSENVGVQDQYHAAFGGLNRFDFDGSRVRLSPVQMSTPCLDALTASLCLLYTGLSRYASDTLNEQMARTREGRVERELSHLLALTAQGVEVLESADPERMLADLGAMMHDGWETKKRLSSKVSNPHIDALYDAARAAGALGGKLCGAGSGGFLLMVVPPERQAAFADAMRGTTIVPIGIDTVGSTILTG